MTNREKLFLGLAIVAGLLFGRSLAAQTAGTPSQIKGTGAPSSGLCIAGSVGQEYFRTDATAGQNVYRCTSAGVWTQMVTGITGLVLLQSQTASSSAQLDFNSCISSAYDSYQIHLLGFLPATNSVDLLLEVSTDGGATWITSSSYQGYLWFSSGSGSNVSWNSGSDTAIKVAVSQASAANIFDLSGVINIPTPLGATNYAQITGTGYYLNSSGVNTADQRSTMLYGAYKSTTAINAIRLHYSSGNISKGVARCYGVAK